MQKVILITGTGRGLGRAMTQKFIECRHRIIGCSINPRAVAELQKTYPPPHDFAVVDVSDYQQVQAWCDRLAKSDIIPDLLINNAGVINTLAPLWQVSALEFDRVIDVNLKGTANVIRSFLPQMLAQRRGIIINFSSGWGRSTSAQVAPYCASKWAIEGLTQALAQELPPGLAAIALNPGIINTEMLQSCFGAEARNYPPPSVWAQRAVAKILQISSRDNGKSMSV
jgi:NAD(P)-dependent dehydrogenase (short-subunit alcohol dehydrogenase family)